MHPRNRTVRMNCLNDEFQILTCGDGLRGNVAEEHAVAIRLRIAANGDGKRTGGGQCRIKAINRYCANYVSSDTVEPWCPP